MITPDQHHRDSIRNDIHKGLFVEAGAGTGKTTALVGRIISLVRSGFSLGSIAAITFTNKAAGELRDRLRRELESSAQDEPSAEVRLLFEDALDDLEEARIQTIHGFALRLLADYPLEAGLPPAVHLLDEFQAKVEFDEWWDATLADLLTNESLRKVWPEALDLGLTVVDLKKLAAGFDENLRRMPADLVGRLTEDLNALRSEILRTGRFLVDIRSGCTKATDGFYNKIGDLEPWLDAFAKESGPRAAVHDWPYNMSGGSANYWPRYPGIKKALEDYRTLGKETLPRTAALALVAPILQAILDAVRFRTEARKQAGALTFNDVLVLARDLLLTNEEVRQDVRRQIQRLMIDEFQDTDPQQMEIAALIAASHRPSLDFDWRKAELDLERLFFVGDPKQSIYRFRGADISVYTEVQGLFSSTDVVSLSVNFRSRHGLLKWINALFEPLFQEQPEQVSYKCLECPESSDELSVMVLGRPTPEGRNRTANEVRDAEATEIAETLLRARDEGWLVGKGEKQRPARFEDMAILIPTRTCLGALESAFREKDIPFRVECQSLIWESQEARDLVEVLAALDDPSDSVAVVATLRSSLFACSDMDLAEYHNLTRGDRWNYERADIKELPGSRVVRALQFLAERHMDSRSMPMNEILDRLLRDRFAFEAATYLRRPRDRWQRLRLLQDQARAFDDADGGTLGQFVKWARAQQQEGVRLEETVVSEPDDDAVRILTVHASKGLEFPIVYLAGLGTVQSNANKPAVFWSAGGQLEISLGPIATPGAKLSSDAEKIQYDCENGRLLYVAATRAQDYLVISLHHRPGKADKPDVKAVRNRAEIIHRQIEKGILGQLHTTRPTACGVASAVPVIVAKPDKSVEQWRSELDSLPPSLRKMPALAATTIATMRSSETGRSGNGEFTTQARGVSGTGFGRAVHAALQTVNLASASDDEIKALAKLGAEGEGIPAAEEQIAIAVRSALASSILGEAAAGKYHKEVFLSACIHGIAVEGFLDLLFQDTAGEWVIVDYKTDRTDDPARLMSRYNHQAAVYALLVREQLGKLPARCVFLFVNAPDALAAVQVRELDAKVSDLESWLSTGAPLPGAYPQCYSGPSYGGHG